MLDLLGYARWYLQKGLTPIPIKPGEKTPALSSWREFQKRKPTDDELVKWFDDSNNNIGIVTGSISGICVVDMDSENAFEFAKANNFPLSPMVKTGKGYHQYYRYRQGVRNFQKRDDLPEIDLRGDGGYVVAPPSVHKSGHHYEWIEAKGLEDIPLAELPEMILSSRPDHKRSMRELYQGAPEGSRNDALARLMGSWVKDGLSFDECFEQALIWNTRNEPKLDNKEIEQTVRSIFELHLREKETKKAIVRRAKIVCLNDVQAASVEWLWNPYIPLGKLTMLEGDPAVGKSFLSMTLAAIISRGWPFPGTDGTPNCEQVRSPSKVVYLSAEDGLADTIKTRLVNAGADCTHLYALTGIELQRTVNSEVKEVAITLEDKDILEEVMKDFHPALVVIDPIQAYLGKNVDMHRANEVRPLLAGLAQLADKYRCAVLVVRHLTKGQTDRSMYRGMGSIDFTAAARSVILAARDPQNPAIRVLVHLKSSNAPEGPSLGYEIRDGVFVWTGISDLTADVVLGPDRGNNDREVVEGRREAEDFLNEILKDGPLPSREIFDQGREIGISVATLKRAKKALSIVSARETEGNKGKGRWIWTLLEQEVF